MTATLSLDLTVGELVRQHPARSRVFEAFQIDYCCGGKVPLAEACARKGLDPQSVLELLQQADAPDAALVDADRLSLCELADHIEQTHHAYLRRELPRLDFMTEKVARVHGEREPRLAVVRGAFVALREELAHHMMKEEQILFPIIRQMESTGSAGASHCGSVANPIRQMEHEHDNAGCALATMHDATDGYQPPEWACNTFRALYDALAQLQRDMHQHVHKENNVLFPKAIALEQQLLCGR
jgi:regulator of cell morphogenesis and NO signaling